MLSVSNVNSEKKKACACARDRDRERERVITTGQALLLWREWAVCVANK